MEPFDKNMTILIVDDQTIVRRMMRDMLRKVGYQNFIQADDGDQALLKLRTNKVDLVLCDWNMPTMTGVEVLWEIRADDQLRDLPFIMVTGELDEATVAQAIEGDVDAYLLKPFTADMLHQKVIQVMERKTNPSAVEVHLNVGQIFIKAKRYDEALAELEKGLKINPKSARILTAMGEVHEAKGDLTLAKDVYLKAIRFVPKYIKAHDALGRVYNALGQPQKASSHLKAAVTISPKNVNRQYTLGETLLISGSPKEAQRVFTEAMKVAGDKNTEIARRVGEAYLNAGMAADAQFAFQKGLDVDPSDIHLYNRLGIAYRKQKKFDEAVTNYLKALDIEPDNEILHYNLGRAYYDAGAIDKATDAMRKALEIHPEFEEAKLFLTRTLKANIL